MINKHESILYRTHQAWKYDVSLAIHWLGMTIAIVSFYYYYAQYQWPLLGFVIAGMLFVSGYFMALKIKCPNCGTRWYWQALKTTHGDNGLEKLRSQKNCPICKLGINEVDSKGHLIGQD